MITTTTSILPSTIKNLGINPKNTKYSKEFQDTVVALAEVNRIIESEREANKKALETARATHKEILEATRAAHANSLIEVASKFQAEQAAHRNTLEEAQATGAKALENEEALERALLERQKGHQQCAEWKEYAQKLTQQKMAERDKQHKAFMNQQEEKLRQLEA